MTKKPSKIKKCLKTHKVVILLLLAIVVQSLIYVKVGFDKSYIHMDEAYSLGLASYDKVEIQDNDDFYDTWHSGEYYEDYLAVNDDETGDFAPVYNNQRNDVHPPLYYLLLRVVMSASPNHFSKWGGIAINIVIYAFITIFAYFISLKLMGGKEKDKIRAVLLAFVSSITLGALTSVIYIRMYALATLNIMMITYCTMKLYEKFNWRNLVLMGIVTLVGSLTHYFFLFYLAMLFVIMVVHYARKKNWKQIAEYIATLAVAGAVSLAIFPYSVQHMFFGYRGDGVISKLTNFANFPEYFANIGKYLSIIQVYVFNSMLVILTVLIIGIYIYRWIKGVKSRPALGPYFKLLCLPTLFYTLLVAVSTPWIELRYVMPVCATLFIMVFYWLWRLCESVVSVKVSGIALCGILAITAVLPIFIGPEPQVAYTDKREIVQQVQGELNVPTVFWFNSNENRFLDDILLFSLLDESYVAKDASLDAETIQGILEGRDLSDGILVFINSGQQNDDVLKAFVDSTELDSATHLKRMNACDIYYLK